MKRYVCAALVALAALFSAMAGGFDLGHDFSMNIEGVRTFKGFIPSGADISFTYSGFKLYSEGITKLYLMLGGGYEDLTLFRDVTTGNPWFGDPKEMYFHAPKAEWALAFIQGLMRREDQENLVEVFAYYRGRYDHYKTAPWTDAVFKDIHGFLGTSFMAGFSYDSVITTPHRAKRGIYSEFSAEWAPAGINLKSSFWRISGQLRGFLPLYDYPTDSINLFCMYLAGFYGMDYSNGATVPIYVNQSFGGRSLRGSVGSVVRGYGSYRYDTQLKTVGNLELRFVGPAMGISNIVPVLFAFIDGGYYHGFKHSQDFAKQSGFLASSGVGLAIDIMGFAQIGAVIGGRLVKDTPMPYVYKPANFFWSIQMMMHF